MIKGGYVLSLALTYPLLFCVMREVLVELAVVKEGGVIGGFGLVVGGYRPGARLLHTTTKLSLNSVCSIGSPPMKSTCFPQPSLKLSGENVWCGVNERP